MPSPALPPMSPVVAIVATFFGAGLIPRSPGTMGTLATVPLAYGLLRLGPLWVWAATVFVTAIGTWAAGRYCAATGRHDNQRIVIDEVAGYLLTLALLPPAVPGLLLYLNLAVAFGLFRLLDIWKPWPIRAIDRGVHGGFGVMADDLCAGAIGACLLRLGQPGVRWLADVLAGAIGGSAG